MRVLLAIQSGRASHSFTASLFRRFAGSLRKTLGWDLTVRDYLPVEDLHLAIRGFDLALVAVSWDEPAESVVAAFETAAAVPGRPQLLFLDWYDQATSPHFGVLPYVDLYVKGQVLRGISWYTRDWERGTPFGDFIARAMRLPREDSPLTSWADPAHVHKIVVGWNIAAGGFERLLRIAPFVAPPWSLRPIDMHARVGLGEPGSPYRYHRHAALAGAQLLARDFRVCAGARVSRAAYLRELFCSKLVLSPFGYGEVCFRDFEVTCAGALLLKPSMEHLRTNPDIYEPHVTYVPLRWDLADLEEKCVYFLEHPAEARRMASRARARFASYHARGGFVADVSRVSKALRAGCTEPAVLA
jgi:hypothetical protein